MVAWEKWLHFMPVYALEKPRSAREENHMFLLLNFSTRDFYRVSGVFSVSSGEDQAQIGSYIAAQTLEV
jgi:hypothetical protein